MADDNTCAPFKELGFGLWYKPGLCCPLALPSDVLAVGISGTAPAPDAYVSGLPISDELGYPENDAHAWVSAPDLKMYKQVVPSNDILITVSAPMAARPSLPSLSTTASLAGYHHLRAGLA